MRILQWAFAVVTLLWNESIAGQQKSKMGLLPFCEVAASIPAGTHQRVAIAAIYLEGREASVLYNPMCAENQSRTWVKFALKSQQNKKELQRTIKKNGRAYVEFEGELYGPPLPDPALPEALRNRYHPGWGHSSAYRTQMVVESINKVAPVPAEVLY